jgi:hypothetical protein
MATIITGGLMQHLHSAAAALEAMLARGGTFYGRFPPKKLAAA